MPLTALAFRQKVRDAIADNNTSGIQEFTDKQLDGWTADEVGMLYSRNLFVRSSTRTLAGYTEPTIVAGTGQAEVARYYPLPTGFRRVYAVEFVNTTSGAVAGDTRNFDDLEEPGQVRIDGAADYVGYKLRFFGEREYTGVTDASMNTEVIELVKYGVVLQAMNSELVRRTKAARSQVATRTTDASPGAISAAIAVIERQWHRHLSEALAIQAIKTFAR